MPARCGVMATGCLSLTPCSAACRISCRRTGRRGGRRCAGSRVCFPACSLAPFGIVSSACGNCPVGFRRARRWRACSGSIAPIISSMLHRLDGWPRLTEPQVTKAIAHFLQSEDPIAREGRIGALLSALSCRLEGGSGNARVSTEAPVAGKRSIDLLVEWQDGRGFDRALVIEAKFGHDVTPGQLSAYRRHLRRIERRYRRAEHDGGPELLFVVSPDYRKSDARALARNKYWC